MVGMGGGQMASVGMTGIRQDLGGKGSKQQLWGVIGVQEGLAGYVGLMGSTRGL